MKCTVCDVLATEVAAAEDQAMLWRLRYELLQRQVQDIKRDRERVRRRSKEHLAHLRRAGAQFRKKKE